jgi:hypothetical protein
VFVTGSSDGVPSRQTDFVTIAYDASTGMTLWTARLDDAVHSDDGAVAAALSSDGKHLYVTGSACVAKGALFCSNMDYLTVSYDAASGAEEWRSGYGGAANGDDSPKRVASSNDGAVVIVTGQSWGGSGYDYATVAYNARTGAQQWVARYDGPGQGSDTAQGLKISSDGITAYVTGTSRGETSGSDFATIAYNTMTGATLWTTRFDGAAHEDDYAVGLALAPDGNVLYVTGSAVGNSTGRDFAVIAYSTVTGNVLWTQIHDGEWNGDDWPSAIAVSSDGTRVFVTGREDEDVLASEATTLALAADTGTELWVSRYSAGKHQNQPQDIAPTPDGKGVVVTVTSLSAFPYSSADYVTILYGATFGEARWSGRYDGPGKDDDESAALTLSPDSSTVFVTGISAGYRTATASDWDCATVAYSLPVAPTIVSRKSHGDVGKFDIDLPLIGAAGIECRSGGPNGDYQIVFTFGNPLTNIDHAIISSGNASVSSREVDSTDAHRYIVNLTAVANAQTLTLSLFGVREGANTGDLSVPLAVLLGDTTQDGFVNSADIAQTKSQSGTLVTSSNFREDVTVDGNLNSADIALVKSKSGTALATDAPSPPTPSTNDSRRTSDRAHESRSSSSTKF